MKDETCFENNTEDIPAGAWVTYSVVVKLPLDDVPEIKERLLSWPRLRLIYERKSLGKLRIVEEG